MLRDSHPITLQSEREYLLHLAQRPELIEITNSFSGSIQHSVDLFSSMAPRAFPERSLESSFLAFRERIKQFDWGTLR